MIKATQRMVTVLVVAFVLATHFGCTSATTTSESVQPKLSIVAKVDTEEPTVGEARVVAEVKRADGTPVSNAQVTVEGNMNHAGMKPSFGDLSEESPGVYAGNIDFTMGGDWYIVVSVETSEGESVEHQFDVKGVAAK